MAAFKGRLLIAKWGGTSLGGVREKSLQLNGERIDISSDDDAGWQKLHDTEAAQKEVQVTISGVSKDNVLRSDWFNGTNCVRVLELDYPDGGIITGTFHLESFSETGTYNDAVSYEATFRSSGAITFAP